MDSSVENSELKDIPRVHDHATTLLHAY